MLVPLGPIQRLQIQPVWVKSGKPLQYDPAGLLSVGQLRISPGGISGVDDDGREVPDVHHADHPASRHRGDNAVSLSFTSHYAAMRAHFGDHMADGCGAENILIGADRIITVADLRRTVVIRSAATGAWAVLDGPKVDAPCAPFARFAAGGDATPAELKAALQWLDHGRRGFYLMPGDAAAMVIELGDMVYAADAPPAP